MFFTGNSHFIFLDKTNNLAAEISKYQMSNDQMPNYGVQTQ